MTSLCFCHWGRPLSLAIRVLGLHFRACAALLLPGVPVSPLIASPVVSSQALRCSHSVETPFTPLTFLTLQFLM